MAKKPSKHGQKSTGDDVQQLRQLSNQNTPTRVMGIKLGRTPDAVSAKASEERISLKPVNQRPYNRRSK